MVHVTELSAHVVDLMVVTTAPDSQRTRIVHPVADNETPEAVLGRLLRGLIRPEQT